MPGKRTDRRIGRTRRRLKEALLQLIQERGYEEIAVEDITRRADVGRSTFYSHFKSKEDLLFAGFDHWLRSLTEAPPERITAPASAGDAPNRFRFSRPLLEHIASQKRFFQATIVQASDVRVRRKTVAFLVEMVRLELARMAPPRGGAVGRTRRDVAIVREAQAHYLVGALLGLVGWWLDAGKVLDADAVDGVFQRMVNARALA